MDFETLMKWILEMCSSSSKLILVFTEMEGFLKLMKEAGKNLGTGLSPDVYMAILDFDVQYHAVLGKARVYVAHCKDMAAYVCESGVFEEVRRDLEERNSTAELTYFLEDLVEYVLCCKFSHEELKTLQKEVEGKLQLRCNQWYGESMKEQESERLRNYLCRGSSVVAVGAVVSGASSIICPPLALIGALIGGYAACICASESGICQEKKEVFKKAKEITEKVLDNMNQLNSQISRIECNLALVREVYIGGTAKKNDLGLKEIVARVSSGEGSLRMVVVRTQLGGLKDTMGKILQSARQFLDL